jgi:hypothetical protein
MHKRDKVRVGTGSFSLSLRYSPPATGFNRKEAQNWNKSCQASPVFVLGFVTAFVLVLLCTSSD